jgi:hypothetical protein
MLASRTDLSGKFVWNANLNYFPCVPEHIAGLTRSLPNLHPSLEHLCFKLT